MRVQTGFVICLAVLTYISGTNFARAEDEEPRTSRFVLDFSTVELDGNRNDLQAVGDLSLIANLVLGCNVEASDDLSPTSNDFLSRIQGLCPNKVFKWPSNVEFWIGGTSDWLRDSSSEDARFVVDVLDQVGERVGVEFDATLFRPSAELTVLILSEEAKALEREALTDAGTKPSIANAMRPLLEGKGSGCVGMSKVSEEGVLIQYILAVDAERETASRHLCMAESLIRLMGLAGNYPERPLVRLFHSETGDRIYGASSDGVRTLELLYSGWLLPNASIGQAFEAYLALLPTNSK